MFSMKKGKGLEPPSNKGSNIFGPLVFEDFTISLEPAHPLCTFESRKLRWPAKRGQVHCTFSDPRFHGHNMPDVFPGDLDRGHAWGVATCIFNP